MRSKSYYLFVFFLLVLVSACAKKSDDFVLIDTGSQYDYYSIEVFENKVYAAGGDVWQQSDLSISTDGLSLQSTYFTNRAIFDLHAAEDELLAVGTSGWFFGGEGSELSKIELSTNSLFRAVTDTPNGYIAIAGKDFNKGWLYRIDDSYQILDELVFEQELSDVKCNAEGNCIAVGYGIILYTTDGGETWQRSAQDGDFYNSVAFDDAGNPVIVGYNGSILRSQTNGETWIAARNAHSPLANNKPFRKIKFLQGSAYIIGDNGTIWKSTDQAQSWTDISVDTELDLYDCIDFDQKLLMASEKGQIITINL